MSTEWSEIAAVIVGAAHRFAVPVWAGTVSGTQNPEALLELLSDADVENEEIFVPIIREFGKSGTWPEVTELQQLLLYIRCRNALWFLTQLGTYIGDFPLTDAYPVSQPPPKTPREVLVLWLLDFLWKQHRDFWLPGAVGELLGGPRM